MTSYVGYVRDSGGQSQDLSTSQQRSAIQEWALTNGHIIAAWYEDAARPGSSTVGRTGFQSMIDRFRSGAKEDGVIVWSMSRWSRDIDDSAFFRADLRRRGYQVLSVTDTIPEGPMGRLFESLLDWRSEQFLIDLSTDVKRGLSNLVVTYGGIPGTPPRGFKREPVELPDRRSGQPHRVARWVPDPDMAPRVLEAFAMRASGLSLAEINSATHLYKGLSCYTTFFTNRLYIGELRFGDQVIPNYCEAIVPPDIWTAVQAIVKETAARANLHGPRHPRRVTSSYLLSGLAFCARCGSPLFGAGSTRKGHTYERYACTAAIRRRDCDLQPVPRTVLDKAVLDAIAGAILQPEMIEAARANLVQAEADYLVRIAEERTGIATQLQGVSRKIGNVTAAIAETGPGRALTEKLRQLEAEEAGLMAQQAALSTHRPSPIPNDRQVELMRVNLESAPQSALRTLVTRILVDRDGQGVTGEIIWHYPP